MLRQRVITAFVMLALLLPALFASSPWPFAVVTLLLMGTAGWEWGRLNGANDAGSVVLGLLLAAACGAALYHGWALEPPSTVWWLAMLLWVLGGSWVLRRGVPGWAPLPRSARWIVGLVAMWTAWLALANAKNIGMNFILSVLCLAWMADVAAYFGGRTFGRRKLALGISPGKTWEGVWSGVVGVVVLALAWIAFDRAVPTDTPSLYTLGLDRLGPLGLLLMLVFLCAMSVIGDLLESLVKRSAGVKDSSGLLPGHGGVLDRVDALLPVFPLALAFGSL